MKPFECVADAESNIRVAAGWVIEIATGRTFRVGGELPLFQGSPVPGTIGGTRSFASSPAEYFQGGSGRNADVIDAPGTNCPQGYFKAYTDSGHAAVLFAATLTFLPDGSAELDDGTDILASAGPGTWNGTIAPTGYFPMPATTYGETSYNGGFSFTLQARREGGGYAFPSCNTHPDEGTALADEFTATDADHYTAVTNPAWTLVVNGDGTADIADGTDIVASRPGGNPHDPEGYYDSSSYGAATFNGGVGFSIRVIFSQTQPVESWIWVEITESSPGVIASVAGPFRATTMPASADPIYRVPVAHTDGSGNFSQIQEGPIYWFRS